MMKLELVLNLEYFLINCKFFMSEVSGQVASTQSKVVK